MICRDYKEELNEVLEKNKNEIFDLEIIIDNLQEEINILKGENNDLKKVLERERKTLNDYDKLLNERPKKFFEFSDKTFVNCENISTVSTAFDNIVVTMSNGKTKTFPKKDYFRFINFLNMNCGLETATSGGIYSDLHYFHIPKSMKSTKDFIGFAIEYSGCKTQKEFCEITGYGAPTVSRWSSGERVMSSENMLKICNIIFSLNKGDLKNDVND